MQEGPHEAGLENNSALGECRFAFLLANEIQEAAEEIMAVLRAWRCFR